MSDFMNIWRHAEFVDADCTKEDSSGGYKATSINGYWFIQEATKLWGPCGIGWGYEILEERFDEGPPIKDPDSDVPLCKTSTHTIKLQLWYMSGEERKTVIQFGHTPYIYQSKYGPRVDGEAPKKSLMDAIKKSLSMLGFAADVYMGDWDDPAYVALRHAEADIENADNREEKLAEEVKKIDDYGTRNLRLMGETNSVQELEKIHKAVSRYLSGLEKSKSEEIRLEARKQLARTSRGHEKRKLQLTGEAQ